MSDEQIPLAFRQRLEKKLGISTRGVYKRIAKIARDESVSSRAAAFILARDIGVNYSHLATSADRAEIRGHSANGPAPPLPAPTTVLARKAKAPAKVKQTKNNSIFVVHGRDAALNRDMYAFLSAIGIVPMEWNHAIKAAKGGANPIVGDVIS